ncbi:Transcriptional regulator, DeoR family [Fimbriiglobus ruber]|uniref:Transcriptional regulator, DeoR family n=2 Tax=Fimbriiglobus ruber TaxID=1908690 RepID=A0A225DDE1_9BACT|nr:Transcriptional regulator, DeoR family [Fimbriiglobus ruber]
MLQLLLGRSRWNYRDIAAEQECSERTVHRDRGVLQLAGIPVDHDEDDKCLRIRQDFRFPAFNVTEDEALGQGTAAAITKGPGLDINEGASLVKQKLAATSKEETAQILADAEELVTVLDLKLADHSRHRDIIRTIQWALIKRKQLVGTYRSPHEPNEVTLHLHPYRLCLVKQAWYLIARPATDDAVRTYRVARFKTLRMLDAKAEVPQDFDLKEYFGNAWAVYRGDRSFDVEIVFAREAASTVTEGIWHHTQKVHKNKDGSVTLTFQVDGLNEILRWILGWGSRAKVIQPSELCDMILAQLNQSLEGYRA